MPMLQQMKDIESRFQSASGLVDRRHYKIYYSRIHPFPILVLGYNPGGASDGTDLSASASFFENWEHDYPCFRNHPRYPLAAPMCELLSKTLGITSVNELRQIPATNVIFRRSRDMKRLNSKRDAIAETARFLAEIIRLVQPTAILFISKTAYDIFLRSYCERGSITKLAKPQYTPNGRGQACIYQASKGFVRSLSRPTELLMVGHPSKYARRAAEWQNVTNLLGARLRDLGLCPLSDTGHLAPLADLPGYGEIV